MADLKWRLVEKTRFLGTQYVVEIAIRSKWNAVQWSCVRPSIEMVQLSLLPAVEALRLATGRDYTPVQYCRHNGKWVPCRSEEEE